MGMRGWGQNKVIQTTFEPTCNYRLPQTFVVLLYIEQSSDTFGHEATWGYLGKM